jgi:hypothetical protein
MFNLYLVYGLVLAVVPPAIILLAHRRDLPDFFSAAITVSESVRENPIKKMSVQLTLFIYFLFSAGFYKGVFFHLHLPWLSPLGFLFFFSLVIYLALAVTLYPGVWIFHQICGVLLSVTLVAIKIVLGFLVLPRLPFLGYFSLIMGLTEMIIYPFFMNTSTYRLTRRSQIVHVFFLSLWFLVVSLDLFSRA